MERYVQVLFASPEKKAALGFSRSGRVVRAGERGRLESTFIRADDDDFFVHITDRYLKTSSP